MIGNLDDEQTIKQHQASIPEMMRMVKEFGKSKTGGQVGGSDNRHHEMYPKFQEDFRCDVLFLLTPLRNSKIHGKTRAGFYTN